MMVDDRVTLKGSLQSGLLAGSVAGLVAAFVSLPLHSPHDGLLNTASIVLGSLAMGIISGQVWRILPVGQRRGRNFIALTLVAFGVIAIFAVIAETQIDRAVSFILPLAAIAIVTSGVGVPYLTGVERLSRWWLVSAAVIIASVVGAGLASQGDQRSGRLELPPRSANVDRIVFTKVYG